MQNSPAYAEWLGQTNDVTRMFLAAGQIPGLINMAGGLPDPSVFPADRLADMAAEVLRTDPETALGYAAIEGLPALRAFIADRFSAPDLRLEPENVLVTTGGMQALDLVGKVLLDAGGLVAVQAPTYLGALDAWRPRAPAYRPIHPGGNDFDAVAALDGAQFAYTVPNFSNPTGRLVGTAQRRALVDAARASGTWLVEDDPYGTLYYDGPELPRMLTLSGNGAGPYDGPVIYMGTLSKELAPGLRVGWIIAAPEMISALTLAKQGSDMSTGGLSQALTLAAFRSGLVAEVLPGTIALYRRRRDALCAAMDRHLADIFDWEVPSGGMFVWAVARDPGFDTDRLLQAALDARVCVAPSSVFDPMGRDRRAVRINFTRNPEDALAEGIKRLRIACEAIG